MLSEVIPYVQKVTDGRSLTAEEAKHAFSILISEDLESYFFFTFLGAMHAKGETSDELLGFCQANESVVPRIATDFDIRNVIDNSGTGGDRLKTFNVSTAAAFILAGEGALVPKQAFFAVTGFTGSADLVKSFGVDVMSISAAGADRVIQMLRRTGVSTYVAQFMGHPDRVKGIINWSNKRREIGLNFVTVFHLAANAYTPIPMARRVYGMFSPKYLRLMADLFQKLGYTRVLVVHGDDGLDEVSNVGPTRICELNGDSTTEYTVTPEELGVKRAQPDEVRASSRDGNIADFLHVLYGRDNGPKADLVLVNAAAGLYVLDRVQTLKDGVELARANLKAGRATKKLEEFIGLYGDLGQFESVKRAAGIK